MLERLFFWFVTSLKALMRSHFIAWNLFLAFIPFALSLWLFKSEKPRSWLWWLGLLTFVAFLPNAPYVLTDTVHLINFIRNGYSIWIVTLVLIPQYTLFLGAGFGAYVLSLINLGDYLKQEGKSRFIFPCELMLHFLSAVGIFLGRFQRFNSWDFVTKPIDVFHTGIVNFYDPMNVLVIGITFIVLTMLYWLGKQLAIGLKLRFQQTKEIRS
ncbi:DUF1361 domain-containing protein [Spirulina sp. 06S082]|uniref:DUF1361 domain-containing protein n=1 Tax=Spirulina sp. 06S082 TaxID=3110248 RepID=UPI002B20B4D9|nr:DUF1361 domain-containing protein [Spirulina sp. 06S082]MEA5471135.1 DUF1361 domain-containing protein [Spirulina sp. 06S082]